MKVYLDASVVVRKLQGEAGSLADWGQWEAVFSSELLRVEVLRSIDRNRIRGALTDENVADLMTKARDVFDAIQFLEISEAILRRASQSFLTPLGTLDALHLATAVGLAEQTGIDLLFLTHDAELAVAARSMNFAVKGV